MELIVPLLYASTRELGVVAAVLPLSPDMDNSAYRGGSLRPDHGPGFAYRSLRANSPHFLFR